MTLRRAFRDVVTLAVALTLPQVAWMILEPYSREPLDGGFGGAVVVMVLACATAVGITFWILDDRRPR